MSTLRDTNINAIGPWSMGEPPDGPEPSEDELQAAEDEHLEDLYLESLCDPERGSIA